MAGVLSTLVAASLIEDGELVESFGSTDVPDTVATGGARLHKAVVLDPGDLVTLWERSGDEDLARIFIKTTGMVYLMPTIEPLAGGSDTDLAGFAACHGPITVLTADDWLQTDGTTKMRLVTLKARRLATDTTSATVEVLVVEAE